MMLRGVKKEVDWQYSEWQLTYPIGWDSICRGIMPVYEDIKDAEILVDGETVAVSKKEEIPEIRESGRLTIRGMSSILNVPVMLTFYNQLALVRATVAAAGEYAETDYERFNLSMCQYMDSIELAMYR